MKRIGIDLAPLGRMKPQELLQRFLFGGLSTVVAGLIAKRYGPAIGGLFLAFPAIFPASATLIVTREKERLARIGADGANRGRIAAGIDAGGAVIGCAGLIVFALILWRLLPQHSAPIVILAGGIAWLAVSCAIWLIPLRRLRRNST